MLSKYLKLAVAMSVAASSFLVPQVGTAQEGKDPLGTGGLTPEGFWESESGDSRYDVTLCGPDGDSLCVELSWIRPKDRNDRNVTFLNEMVVDEARRTRPLQWKGRLNVYGTEYAGTVKMLDKNTMRLTACVFILCESQEYVRIKNPGGADGS